MTRLLSYILILLISSTNYLSATDWSSFKKGEGAKYYMKSVGSADSEVSIYFTDVKKDTISVEFYMYAQNTLIPVQLFQQFELTKDSKGSLKLAKGFIKTPQMKTPQILSSENLTANPGVKMDDFLFSDEKTLQTLLVETTNLKIMAGNVKANHYRKTNNNQTVDFWISDESKPLGLVKLISKGPKESHQNYEMELMSQLKNVKAGINPKEAKGEYSLENEAYKTTPKWW